MGPYLDQHDPGHCLSELVSLSAPGSHRFGPYYTEPVIAGLDPKTFEPFICSLDLIGCPMVTDDFVVSGTCAEQMYGMCESLWEPDMVSWWPDWFAPFKAREALAAEPWAVSCISLCWGLSICSLVPRKKRSPPDPLVQPGQTAAMHQVSPHCRWIRSPGCQVRSPSVGAEAAA